MPTVAPNTTGRLAADVGRRTTVDAGLLLPRVIPFGLLAVHGAQKLFGAFGGRGLEGTAAGLALMGYEPALFFAVLGGGCELAGGLLLVLGLFAPLGAAMALGVMINAATRWTRAGAGTGPATRWPPRASASPCSPPSPRCCPRAERRAAARRRNSRPCSDPGARPPPGGRRGAHAVKYMLLIYNIPATPRWTGDVAALAEEITHSGELLGHIQLADPINATTVRPGDRAVISSDGPFPASKEQLAYCFVVDCDSPRRAVAIAARFPGAHACAVEVRPIMESGGLEM